MPSSPKRPCSTGNTTSTEVSALTAVPGSTDTRPPALDGSVASTTASPVVDLRQRAVGDPQPRPASASVSTQRPGRRDADGHDLVALRVERGEHAAGRDHRDAVLAAAPAVDDGHPYAFHADRPYRRVRAQLSDFIDRDISRSSICRGVMPPEADRLDGLR